MQKKKKILLIEDDLSLSKIYSNKLRRNEFEVSVAITGEEGLHKALMENPDLILLDLILPDKDGFQVLTELQKSSQTKDTPVIIISNLGQESDIKRGMALGAKDYLVKANISLINIIEKIKKYLPK